MATEQAPIGGDDSKIAGSDLRLKQYFIMKDGGQPDFTLAGLDALYRDLATLNSHFFSRIQAACTKDANLNAVSRLDAFARLTDRVARCKGGEFAPLFEDYFARPA